MPGYKTLYFGYGSNLWLDQMRRRCPASKYVGVGVLYDWQWRISTRGYANIIPSKGDIVYGLIYELSEDDEGKLDGYENVPYSYVKKTLPLMWWVKGSSLKEGIFDGLVYVDIARLQTGSARTEYIHRMNMGINDAIQEGVPQEYLDRYLRPFIPAQTVED